MSCCDEEIKPLAMNLRFYSNEALSRKIGIKVKNPDGTTTLRDLTGYTVKAQIAREPSNIDMQVVWMPPNPDFHFMLLVPAETMQALGEGVFAWDWLLIDPDLNPKRKPGGTITILKGVTLP